MGTGKLGIFNIADSLRTIGELATYRRSVEQVERVRHVVISQTTEISVYEYGTDSSDLPPVVFLPALGVPISYYQPFLMDWAGRGRQVFAVELRGMPRTSARELRQEPFGYSVLVRRDLPAVFSMPALHAPAIAVGHSLGGQLALLATATGTIAPRMIVTLATGSSAAHGAASRMSRIRRSAEASIVSGAAGLLGYWPGHRLGFAGKQPRLLMQDWAHEARTGRYRIGGDDTDYEAALRSIPVPVLLTDVEGDRFIPVESVRALAARLPSTAERLSIAAGARDHFLWARRDPRRVIDPIEEWLLARGG